MCLIAAACCAWLLSVQLSAACAQAAPSTNVRLVWHAPSDCMSQRSAQRNLVALIGEAEPHAAAADVTVEIAARAGRYVAHIAFSGAVSGTRELSGTHCDSLGEAAVLIVGITAAPRAVAERMRASRHAAPAEDDAFAWQLGLALRGDLGSLPQASIGPNLRVGLSLARLHIELNLGYWWPRVQLRGAGRGDGGEIGLWDAALRAGIDVVRGRRVGFGPTAAFAIGSSYGTAVNLRQPNPDQHAPWAASLIGLQLQQFAAPFVLQVAAELGLCIVQPEYSIDNYGPVFRSARFFGRLWLGFAWTIR